MISAVKDFTIMESTTHVQIFGVDSPGAMIDMD